MPRHLRTPIQIRPLGLVLNEAMLFGLPVLATNMVGASLDLIEPGKNGYVFDVGNVDGLAQHLRHLGRSAETRRQFGSHSETIVRRYSYDVCVGGILDALDHVSQDSRRGSSTAVHDRREP